MNSTIMWIIALVAGISCGIAVTAWLSPGKVVITDTVGVDKAELPIGYEYCYDSARYKQEDGKLIVELVYTKRGASDEQ